MPHADHLFRMGSTHDVCQDYAKSGSDQKDGTAWLALSDGCSIIQGANGAYTPDTDIGSRLLVNSFASRLEDHWCRSPDNIFGLNITCNQSVLSAIHLCSSPITNGVNDLTATLLTAIASRDRVEFGVSGDGVYAYHLREKNVWQVVSINFTENRPYYPRLKYHASDRAAWVGNGSQKCKKRMFQIENLSKPSDGKPFEIDLCLSPCFDGYYSFLTRSEVDLVVMFSDGIQSFVHRNPVDGTIEPIPLATAIAPFLSFHNTAGQFVKRRAKRALEDFAKQGIRHTDDLSVAGIFLE